MSVCVSVIIDASAENPESSQIFSCEEQEFFVNMQTLTKVWKFHRNWILHEVTSDKLNDCQSLWWNQRAPMEPIIFWFKMVFVGKPAKSACLVFWRYANFQKSSWLRIICIPKDMYYCHPHHFLEIFETQVNEPIGSYQIQHLKDNFSRTNLTIVRAAEWKSFVGSTRTPVSI